MLVLAKKPDEAFKAPLNTKKQAPVTETEKEDSPSYIDIRPITCNRKSGGAFRQQTGH